MPFLGVDFFLIIGDLLMAFLVLAIQLRETIILWLFLFLGFQNERTVVFFLIRGEVVFLRGAIRFLGLGLIGGGGAGLLFLGLLWVVLLRLNGWDGLEECVKNRCAVQREELARHEGELMASLVLVLLGHLDHVVD